MPPGASHILSTKLRPPTQLADAIDRPRLTARLVRELPKVVLVTAAAGFAADRLNRDRRLALAADIEQPGVIGDHDRQPGRHQF